jgi:hypothetical protein
MHHGDDGVREALPKRERGYRGDEGDRVDTHAPGQKVARHRRKQGDDHWPVAAAQSHCAAVLQPGNEAAKRSAKPSSAATTKPGRTRRSVLP